MTREIWRKFQANFPTSGKETIISSISNWCDCDVNLVSARDRCQNSQLKCHRFETGRRRDFISFNVLENCSFCYRLPLNTHRAWSTKKNSRIKLQFDRSTESLKWKSNKRWVEIKTIRNKWRKIVLNICNQVSSVHGIQSMIAARSIAKINIYWSSFACTKPFTTSMEFKIRHFQTVKHVFLLNIFKRKLISICLFSDSTKSQGDQKWLMRAELKWIELPLR